MLLTLTRTYTLSQTSASKTTMSFSCMSPLRSLRRSVLMNVSGSRNRSSANNRRLENLGSSEKRNCLADRCAHCHLRLTGIVMNGSQDYSAYDVPLVHGDSFVSNSSPDCMVFDSWYLWLARHRLLSGVNRRVPVRPACVNTLEWMLTIEPLAHGVRREHELIRVELTDYVLRRTALQPWYLCATFWWEHVA